MKLYCSSRMPIDLRFYCIESLEVECDFVVEIMLDI